jgi:hypothetical protein
VKDVAPNSCGDSRVGHRPRNGTLWRATTQPKFTALYTRRLSKFYPAFSSQNRLASPLACI